MKKVINYKHGHTRKNDGGPSNTYGVWAAMKRRCFSPKSKKYPLYGGRGITVCERWLTFANFLEDFGELKKGETLDRVDVNGNYCPENCRRATQREQQNNRRDNIWCTLPDGTSGTVSQLCRQYNIKRNTVTSRVMRGMNLVDAITKPLKDGYPR